MADDRLPPAHAADATPSAAIADPEIRAALRRARGRLEEATRGGPEWAAAVEAVEDLEGQLDRSGRMSA